MRGKFFLLLGLIFVALLSVSSAYTIENNVVTYENSLAKLQVYPAEAYNPTNTNYEQFFRLTKKVSGTHDIYVGYSFNAPLRNASIWQLVNGEWINRNQFMLTKQFNSRYYYYTEIPVTFSDANPTQTWKIIYTPTDFSEGKWDLYFWKDDLNREDFFGGTVDLNVTLDPWFHASANTRIPVNITALTTYDTNTTWFIKGWDTSGYTGNNGSIWLIRQDTNQALDIDIEGTFGISSDLNIAFKVPAYIFPVGSALNGTDSNGLMLYIEDNPLPRSTYIQYRDLNQVYWYGDNFDTNTLGHDYNIHSDANWNDAGFISSKGTNAEDFISRIIGISSPTNIILQSRQRSTESTGGGICLNSLSSTSSERGHCLSNTGDIIFREPNIANRSDTTVNSIPNTWFTYFLLEVTDSNANGTAINTNTGDLNSSKLMPSSNYENYLITNEPNFTDLSNIHFDLVGFTGSLAQVDIDWFKVFKYVVQPNISLGSQESLAAKFTLNFRDENTGASINPSTLTLSINGSDANSWADNVVGGSLDINMSFYASGKWVFVYGDSTHTNRTFMYDVNADSNSGYSFTLGMLNDSNGSNIAFKFYNQAGTSVLSDANIEVRDSIGRIAGRTSANANGEITFFLNPNDGGYKFNINDINGSDYNYIATKVTVKVPKDEDTLANITPFNVRKTGVGTQDLNNFSVDVNFFVYANTVDFYAFVVSTDQNYFDRTYTKKFKGQVASYEIQPYLVSGSTGLLTWIYTINYYNNQIVPNILIKATKDIPGKGTNEVESLASDASGTAVFSFVSLSTYTLNFYDLNENFLFTKTPFVPSATSYYAKIDVGSVDYNRVTIYPVSVVFHPTNQGLLVGSDLNVVSVGVDVNSVDSMISSIEIQVKHNGVVLFSSSQSASVTPSIASGYTYYQNVTITSLSSSYPIIVSVQVTTVNGKTTVLSQSFFIQVNQAQGGEYVWDWKADFVSVGNDFGTLGKMLIIFLVVLSAVSYCAMNVSGNPSVLGIIAGIVFGLFTFIGWIDGLVFIILALIGFGGFIVANKTLGG